MECIRVRELLSEYVDGVLDEQLKKSVEEHLLTCNSCAEELASLKIYLEKIRSLDKVEAPRNFIKSLNECLQERPQSENVTRKIFTPMKIKLSFKFAGALATLLFVIYIVKIIQPGGMTRLTQPSKNEVVSDKSAVTDELTEQKATLPSENIRKNQILLPMAEGKSKSASLSIAEVKPIELVLLIKTDIKDIGIHSNVKPISLQVTTAELITEESKDMWEAESSREVEISEMDIDKINIKTLEYKSSIPSQIENILGSSGGRILSVEQNPKSNQVIYAEIPQENYSVILKSLNQLTEFQKPSPTVIKTEENLIQIRIKLTPSQ